MASRLMIYRYKIYGELVELLKRLKFLIGYENSLNIGSDANGVILNFGSARESLSRSMVWTNYYNGKFMKIDGMNKYRWSAGGNDVLINPEHEANPHVAIVGMSGFGKSTLFKSLLVDIDRSGRSALIFDAHNEHEKMVHALNGSVYDAARTGIGLLDLCGLSVGERISALTTLLQEVFGLGYVQATKLSACLWYTYKKCGALDKNAKVLTRTPTVKDLVEEIEIFIKRSQSKGETHTLVHLKDRLSILNNHTFSDKTVDFEKITTGLTSFSLSGLKNREVQVIYIGEMLKRIYSVMKDKEKERGLNLYVMMDEAQFLINNSEGKESIVTDLIAEGRKYGVGVVIATHTASSLSKRIISNMSTFVTFYSREPSEINYVSSLLSGGNLDAAQKIRERLRELRQNQAIIVSSTMRDPTVINTPIFSEVEASNQITDNKYEREELLNAVKSPVLESNLKFDGYLIEDLVSLKLIERFEIVWKGSKETWYMKKNPSLSTEHEVCVKKVSEFLIELNIKNKIWDGPYGPDIIVLEKDRIAVEYETGKKRLHESEKMFDERAKEFSAVIIVVNDRFHRFYKKSFERNKIFTLPFSELAQIKPLIERATAT